MPERKPAKVLLFIHGTFSSTAGSFGPLTATRQGLAFLEAARNRYDALIGFDHRTLAETTEGNAKAILQALGRPGLPEGSTINSIAYSRGGLVYRTLAEQLLAARPDIKLGQAIFVACTNAGTHLAEPENWIAMIDLYTNVIMAGAR